MIIKFFKLNTGNKSAMKSNDRIRVQLIVKNNPDKFKIYLTQKGQILNVANR